MPIWGLGQSRRRAEPLPKITLHDVFTGKAKLEEAVIRAPGGFSVLLAGSGMVEYSRLTTEVRDDSCRS